MPEQISLYINALKNVEWKDIDSFELSSEIILDWLQEEGSLSRRLAQKCHDLTVNLLCNRVISSEQLNLQEISLLSEEECILREVILNGDDEEWVIGRTLMPLSSLEDQQYDLSKLGEIPLGLTVFRAEEVSRDKLQAGWAETSYGKLLARRSRLWMNGKPLLVAELFLPNSPVYAKENV
ncbi:chorismate lyase [Vibrio hannami]|uniref:chorismate lyase n=1 Tax=Vibrio hannami TaxID=2717094 RepID=UPI00240EED8E|nr:chorismate lyase [Vibrio hannami]MDG3086658.1 chorismate lyase [Vibrio hannami]